MESSSGLDNNYIGGMIFAVLPCANLGSLIFFFRTSVFWVSVSKELLPGLHLLIWSFEGTMLHI